MSLLLPPTPAAADAADHQNNTGFAIGVDLVHNSGTTAISINVEASPEVPPNTGTLPKRKIFNPYIKRPKESSLTKGFEDAPLQTKDVHLSAIVDFCLVPPIRPSGEFSQCNSISFMGQQSQFRASTTKQNTKRQKHQSKHLLPGAIPGITHFDQFKKCVICRFKRKKEMAESAKLPFTFAMPHRGHHPRCPDKPKKPTAADKEEKRLKEHFKAPFAEHEKCNVPPTKALLDIFLGPRPPQQTITSKESSHCTVKVAPSSSTPPCFADHGCDNSILVKSLMERVKSGFSTESKRKGGTNVAMLSFAKAVTELTIPKRNVGADGIVNSAASKQKHKLLRSILPADALKVVVPIFRGEAPLDAVCHSIEGQELYIVDWELTFPDIKLRCCQNGCTGELSRARTNLSKNNRLFPIFRVDGAPSWCIVQSYKCIVCHNTINGNDAPLLLSLPEYVRHAYPVDTKYAGVGSTFHLMRSASDMLEDLMLTYGNGDLVSKMLRRAIDNDYLHRLQSYLSYWRTMRRSIESRGESCDMATPLYPDKDTDFASLPPTGATLRELYDKAGYSDNTPYGISDYIRVTREMQSVCTDHALIFDHTRAAASSYRQGDMRSVTAIATTMTETGEVPALFATRSTKIREVAHGLEQLARRPMFNPRVLYTDTWPHKDKFWELIFGDQLKGRLGLFHFMQRIIRTMRQGHVDYHAAMRDLGCAVYRWEPGTYAKLIKAMKEGTIGHGKKKYTDEEIGALDMTTLFKQRYKKYLMLQFHDVAVIEHRLQLWHTKYKVESTDPANPGQGRLDPRTDKTLFTPETRTVVREQIRHASHIVDVMPTEEMYRVIQPTGSTKHGLAEYIALRGESKLEQFHLHLANFANTGMGETLADLLLLNGTAIHNAKIRHKLSLALIEPSARPNIPAYFANTPSYTNHSLLSHVNDLAYAAGYPRVPFTNVRELPDDNGERYLGAYFRLQKERETNFPPHPLNDRCQCHLCSMNKADITCWSVRTTGNPVAAIKESRVVVAITEDIDMEGDVTTKIATCTDVYQTVDKVMTTTESFVGPKPAPMMKSYRSLTNTEMQSTSHNLTSQNLVTPEMCNINAHMQWRQHLTPQWHMWQQAQWHQGQLMTAFAHAATTNAVTPTMWNGSVPLYEAKRPKPQTQTCCIAYEEWNMKWGKTGRPPHTKECRQSRIIGRQKLH
jgi:hypothetical protein